MRLMTEYLRLLTITILSLLSRYPDIPMTPGIKVNWGCSLPWRVGSEASSPAVITVWWSKIRGIHLLKLWISWIHLWVELIADKCRYLGILYFLWKCSKLMEAMAHWKRHVQRTKVCKIKDNKRHCKNIAQSPHLHDVCSPSCLEELTEGEGCQSSY